MTSVDNQGVSSETPTPHSHSPPPAQNDEVSSRAEAEAQLPSQDQSAEETNLGQTRVETHQQAQQSKVQQQREARRRKILDNAKSRLERLNGLQSPNAATTTSATHLSNEDNREEAWWPSHNHHWTEEERCPDPEVEPDLPIYLTRHVGNGDMMSPHSQAFAMNNLLETLLRTQLLGGSTAFPMTQMDAAGETAAPKRTGGHYLLIRCRLHMIISALLSLLVLIVWPPTTPDPLSSGRAYVLLPAGLCVLIDLLFFQEQTQINPLVETALLMLGLRTRWLKIGFQLYSLVANVMVDLSVFLLSLVAFSGILTWLSNERFADLIRLP